MKVDDGEESILKRSFVRVSSERCLQIGAQASLSEVIEALKGDPNETLVVVSSDGIVEGVITFGDVLKFSVEKGHLPQVASELMNQKPLVTIETHSPTDVSVPENVRLVPIVTPQGAFVGAWRRVSDKQKAREMPVLIVAGGRGERLRPATDNLPKPLLRIGGVPILERLLGSLTTAGFRTVYISVAYLADAIMDYFGDGADFGCNIVYLQEKQPLGTGGSLSLLPNEVDSILLTNADLLTDINFSQFVESHKESQAVITMLTREATVTSEYGVVETDLDGVVLGLEEKPSFSQIINGGVYALDLRRLRPIIPQSRFATTELVEWALARGLKVKSWMSSDLWLDLGRPADIERANKAYEMARGGVND